MYFLGHGQITVYPVSCRSQCFEKINIGNNESILILLYTYVFSEREPNKGKYNIHLNNTLI